MVKSSPFHGEDYGFDPRTWYFGLLVKWLSHHPVTVAFSVRVRDRPQKIITRVVEEGMVDNTGRETQPCNGVDKG